jgi:hypothetical protein
MASIRIVKTPISEGHVPSEIQEKLVGLVIPLSTTEDVFIGPNQRGYKVLRSDVVEALQRVGHKNAAEFWETQFSAEHLFFRKEVCEKIS